MTSSKSDSIATVLVFCLCAALLVVAPFYASGKTPYARLILESVGLVLLVVIFWTGLSRGKLYGIASVYLLVSIGLACLYVVPIPFDYWSQLPGRELYLNVYQWLLEQGVAAERYQLSIVPYKTTLALLALLPAALPQPFTNRGHDRVLCSTRLLRVIIQRHVPNHYPAQTVLLLVTHFFRDGTFIIE